MKPSITGGRRSITPPQIKGPGWVLNVFIEPSEMVYFVSGNFVESPSELNLLLPALTGQLHRHK